MKKSVDSAPKRHVAVEFEYFYCAHFLCFTINFLAARQRRRMFCQQRMEYQVGWVYPFTIKLNWSSANPVWEGLGKAPLAG